MTNIEDGKLYDNELAQTKTEKVKAMELLYRFSLAVALLGITYDLTIQEMIREKQASGEFELNGAFQFWHDNFVGDISNAFAYVFGIPVVAGVINAELQRSEEISDQLKQIAENITMILPYVMAIFFLLGAIDGETNQYIFAWGTPDRHDLVGAIYGTIVALNSAVLFRKKIYATK